VDSAIRLRGVRKTFGEKVALEGLDIEIPRGATWGLIGPNGAGKTTAIRIVMAILFPDTGEVEVLGHRSALAAKDRIGYLPEERGVYRKLRVRSFLRHIGLLKGMPRRGLDETIDRWLARVELGDVGRRRLEELSKGMQQKVQFIATVQHEPDLLILDEPFSGLDPVNMRLLRELIDEQRARGATVLFSTHVMQQAEELCEHVVMIDEGHKVLDDSVAGIRRRFDLRTILYEPMHDDPDPARLSSLPMVQRVTRRNGTWELHLADGGEPAAVMRALVDIAPPARLEVHRPSLEDVFIEIVGRRRGEAEQARLRRELGGDAPALADGGAA